MCFLALNDSARAARFYSSPNSSSCYMRSISFPSLVREAALGLSAVRLARGAANALLRNKKILRIAYLASASVAAFANSHIKDLRESRTSGLAYLGTCVSTGICVPTIGANGGTRLL
eukprot:IDg21779t1